MSTNVALATAERRFGPIPEAGPDGLVWLVLDMDEDTGRWGHQVRDGPPGEALAPGLRLVLASGDAALIWCMAYGLVFSSEAFVEALADPES